MAGARGEATIQAGEREVQVLYTNRALADMEAETKKSIVSLLEGFTDGRCGMTEAVIVLRCGMEAARRDARSGGRPISAGDAFDVMDLAGFTTVLAKTMEAVADVLGYGSEELEDSDPNP